MEDHIKKILFYSLITNNNHKKIIECINLNIKVSEKVVNNFLNKNINFISIFSKYYPKIFLHYENYPFIIYFLGSEEKFCDLFSTTRIKLLIKCNNNYSYFDYKFIKNFLSKTKNEKFSVIIEDNSPILKLIVKLLFKKNRLLYICKINGIYCNNKNNSTFAKLNNKFVFSFNLTKNKSSNYLNELFINKIIWLNLNNKFYKWYKKVYNYNFNVYFPYSYKKNIVYYNKLLKFGFKPIKNKNVKDIITDI